MSFKRWHPADGNFNFLIYGSGMINRQLKAVFNWSGGKDSALALWKVLQSGEYEVVSLLTTVDRQNQRSSMHAIPVALLQKQAESIGIPLYVAELEPGGEMQGYENTMREAMRFFLDRGVTHFIFGDIFLQEVRTYREGQLRPYGITVVEPLWGKSSLEIMDEFLASGLQTVVVTTMAEKLGRSFIGRTIDPGFIGELPEEVDVCGENGEYHSFCYGGGMFRWPVDFALGESLYRTYPVRSDDGAEKNYSYWFADLREAEQGVNGE